jgi:DNA-binding NarL/FixJ family response regulator
MRLISLGKSNSAIAALKFTTVKSTENAISRLAKKLKIPSDDANNQRVLIAREFYKLNRGDIGENSPN